MEIYCLQRSSSSVCVQIALRGAGRVTGTLRGPFCRFSKTLPATFPIHGGQSVVVDPCYWTPSLPFRYEVKLRIEAPEGIREHQFLWGLRSCLPHRANLYLTDRRFVVRGVKCSSDEVDLARMRSLHCGLLIDDPSDAICEAASDLGIVIVQTALHDRESIRRLNRHPAVHFSLGEPLEHQDVLAVSGHPGSPSPVLLVDVDTAKDSRIIPSRPTFVLQSVPGGNLADMRKCCDRLQSELAPFGQFAGYLITPSV